MAQSSLQAQLAAIRGTNQQDGVVFSSTKKHEEAFGRGLHFSVQQGHSVVDQGKVSFQASLLHSSSKAASDIPLRVIEDNCVTAFQELSSSTLFDSEYLQELQTQLCGQNKASNKTIQAALVYLSMILSEPKMEKCSHSDYCWHIIEYMLRRYSIYNHNHLWEDLLWVIFPTADRYPQIWIRCLQLIDLATNQSYLWLRSYSDPKAIVHVPPRAMIAQHAMKHNNILRRLTNLANRASSVNKPERGSSYILSFTAAVSVEGLAWVQTQRLDKEHKDAILRIVLPTVLSACCSLDKDDWRGWGYVVSSVLVETMDLTPKVIGLLIEKILVPDLPLPHHQADSILALMAVLFPPEFEGVKDSSYDTSRFLLPLVQPTSNLENNGQLQLLGCKLFPAFAYRYFRVAPYVASALGHLHRRRGVVVAPLVATLCMASLSFRSCNADVEDSTSSRENLALALVLEPDLRSLWTTPSSECQPLLLASLASWIVDVNGSDDTGILERKKAVLKELHRIDPVTCEMGIGKGLKSTSRSAQLLNLLDGIVSLDQDAMDTENWEASMLPPYVAIEHAEPSIRIKATKELISSGDTDHHVISTLVRRLDCDDDAHVVCEICSGLSLLLRDRATSLRGSLQEWIVSGAFKWRMASYSPNPVDGAEDAFTECLQVAGLASRGTEESHPIFLLLVELLAAEIDSPKKRISESAREAVSVLLGGAHTITKARVALANVTGIWSHIQSNYNKSSKSILEDELRVRRKGTLCLFREVSKLNLGGQSLRQVFAVSMNLLNDHTSESEWKRIGSALQKCFEYIISSCDSGEQAVKAVGDVSRVSDRDTFNSVVLPMLHKTLPTICDTRGKKVDPLFLVLEAAARSTSSNSRERLLETAIFFVKKKTGRPLVAVLPALYLLDCNEHSTQALVWQLFEALSNSADASTDFLGSGTTLKRLCNLVTEKKKALALHNGVFLAHVLQACADSSDEVTSLCTLLLHLCDFVVATCDSPLEDKEPGFVSPDWLVANCRLGGCRIVCYVLSAKEAVSGSILPLHEWTYMRRLIDHAILLDANFSPSFNKLMMRAVDLLTEAMSFYPSAPTGPKKRRRSKADPSSSYPADMVDTIISILERSCSSQGGDSLAKEVASRTLTSRSWQENALSTLSKKQRDRLIMSLVSFLDNASTDVADHVMLTFPFNCADLVMALQKNPLNLSIVTSIIRSGSERMLARESAQILFMAFVEKLSEVCHPGPNSSSYDSKHLATSVLLALTELLEKAGAQMILSKESLDRTMSLMTSLLCGTGEARLLTASRPRSVAQRVVVLLIQLHPRETAMNLVPLVVCDMVAGRYSTSLQASFSRMLPLFIETDPSYRPSFFNLFSEFIRLARLCKNEKSEKRLYTEFAKAIVVEQSTDENHMRAATGSLVATLIAKSVGGTNPQVQGTDRALEFAIEILVKSPPNIQLASMSLMLHYSKQCLSAVAGKPSSETKREELGILPTAGDLISAVDDSSKTKTRSDSIISLVETMLSALGGCLVQSKLRHTRKKFDPLASELSLSLLQNLLEVKLEIESLEISNEGKSRETLLNIADGIEEAFQNIIPAGIILSSASEIFQGDNPDSVRASAIRLVAKESIRLGSAEAVFFLDMLPALLNILQNRDDVDKHVVHSTLVATEHLTRALVVNDTLPKKFQAQRQSLSLLALRVTTDMLNSMGPTPLFQNATICCATLTRIVGVASLPYLPRLINPVLENLSVTNKRIVSLKQVSSIDSDVRVSLIALLKAIQSVVETVPNFVPPFLPSILSRDGILSPILRGAEDITIKTSLERIDSAISALPTRVLIPAAARAADNCRNDLPAMVSLLSMMTNSIQGAQSPSHLTPHNQHIFKAAVVAFEFNGSFQERCKLVDIASNLLLSLVLNLSELQLRRLFSSMKEWIGDIDNKKPEMGAETRFAYWTVCSRLSKTLRPIFLPCLSMTFEEAVSELDMAATCLNKQSKESSDGSKRQRVGDTEDYSVQEMFILEPLLSCLEHSFTSDAHDGGSWIRADNNSKYHAIMEPLSRLLQAHVPLDYPVSDKSVSPYVQLTQGVPGRHGTVIGCLTALATAGGNEQLWKPLNHSVLEACSNEQRPEVRRTGLLCLLSLMKSLGEEYMVLLPECLPALSERLEDDDDEICAITREVLNLAEEAIGESLDDALR